LFRDLEANQTAVHGSRRDRLDRLPLSRSARQREHVQHPPARTKPQQLLPQNAGPWRELQSDCYNRNDQDYFFAYPKDYAQAKVEWVGKEFKRRPHHPAFEIIFNNFRAPPRTCGKHPATG
jgi:hypothetical protein